MIKTFNIAGPCRPRKHYMLQTRERCQGLIELIDEEQYFVIHAARQTGKTTLLLELTRQLNEGGEYYALYCSLETVQGIDDPKEGIPAILKVIKTRLKFHQTLKRYPFAEKVDYADFNVALMEAFTYFCEELDKPLVVLFDEVDCLSNGTLISFLRQLRDGYINRDLNSFVHSLALVGMRNIRDYKGKIREEPDTLGSSSPFNIVKTSKTLRNFTPDEITKLYAQHTQATGQVFSQPVVSNVYHYTQGQPWLVNAIACEIVEQILQKKEEILPEHVESAVQTLIFRRDTHIDSLMERLKEARVQRIVEPVILGKSASFGSLDDDYQYVLDLGLLRYAAKQLLPANPIYAEVIIRTLSSQVQMEIDEPGYLPDSLTYMRTGKLDMKRLLSDFQQFWRENSESWTKRYQYVEAAPHLTLQAFLQRIVNSGGVVSREMAAGSKRLDLYIQYQEINYPIELKIRYSEKTCQEGLKQLADYMDKLSCQKGWLIIFDKRKSISWEEKIFWRSFSVGEKTIHVVGV
jgi:hypothetical protein